MKYKHNSTMKGLINGTILIASLVGFISVLVYVCRKQLKLYSYDPEPIRFWFNKKIRLKKKYRTYKSRKRKFLNAKKNTIRFVR